MDTSNSVTGFLVKALKDSPHPEDHETSQTCENILALLMGQLTPILRYVCVPKNFVETSVRCLEVGRLSEDFESFALFVSEKGKFFLALITAGEDQLRLNHGHGGVQTVYHGTDAWMNMPFDMLIKKLQEAFDQSQRKRKEHLTAVTLRAKMLDGLVEVIQKAEENRG